MIIAGAIKLEASRAFGVNDPIKVRMPVTKRIENKNKIRLVIIMKGLISMVLRICESMGFSRFK